MNEKRPIWTIQKDFSFLMMVVFAVVLGMILLLPHEPEKRKQEETTDDQIFIYVAIYWPDGVDIDVDLWGMGPDERPVGYPSPHSLLLDLRRDDLGMLSDITPKNYEMMFSRGLKEGLWVFTAHLYANRSKEEKVSVLYEIYIRNRGTRARTLVDTGTVVLEHVNQEKTLASFVLKEGGILDRGTVSKLPISIRQKAMRTGQ